MEERIEREDLIDIQKEISNAYYERAEAINKKHTINNGLKNSFKSAGFMLILAILASMFPLNAISVLIWILTVISSGTFAYFGVAKYNNHVKREDLKLKIEELEQLQKDMAVDYNLKADQKINANLLSSGKMYNRNNNHTKSNTNNL